MEGSISLVGRGAAADSINFVRDYYLFFFFGIAKPQLFLSLYPRNVLGPSMICVSWGREQRFLPRSLRPMKPRTGS